MAVRLGLPLFQMRPLWQCESRLRVPRRLRQPLWGTDSPAGERRIVGGQPSVKLRIIAACSQMELILDRISKEPNEYSTAMYEQILQETRILCEAQLGVSFESFLAQASLPAMFPLLGALLAVDSSAQGLDFVAQKEYFRHFALLSHTVQLCTQMLQDLSEPALPNQKYFAHQIALVFQCLAGLGPVAEPYRARIQSEFDGLKRALDQPAGLQAAQVSMLRALLGDVRAAVRALSPGVLRRAQPAVQHVLAVYAS